MSRKPEQKLWDQLSKATSGIVDWTRIETSTAGAGIPDLSGVLIEKDIAQSQGHEFWLELKVCKLNGYKTTGLWRPTQIAWQTRRARLGGRVWNMIHHPSSSKLFLYHGVKIAPEAMNPGSQIPDLTTKENDFFSIIEHIRGH